MTTATGPIFTGKPWEVSAPHAPGRIVRGSLLLTSGITARAPDGQLVAPNDMRGQCRQVITNLANVLQAAGTNFERIVKLSVFVVNIDQYLQARDLWLALYVNRPVSTLVEVRRLQVPEMVLEIEATGRGFLRRSMVRRRGSVCVLDGFANL